MIKGIEWICGNKCFSGYYDGILPGGLNGLKDRFYKLTEGF